MNDDILPYEQWIDDSLRNMISRALDHVATHGMPPDHHFYITYRSTAPGVHLPPHLLSEYPEEITIVLQHQFSELQVDEDWFDVSLSFGGKMARLRIPFAAITAFSDPSVDFGVQLKGDGSSDGVSDTRETEQDTGEVSEPESGANSGSDSTIQVLRGENEGADKTNSPNRPPGTDDDKMGEIITLDAFRKK